MTGPVRDWFTHTATLPATACTQVNQQLATYIDTVRDCAHTHLPAQTTVCVSGSLARGEPAACRRDGTYRLGSDVDLVAVVDHIDDNAQGCVAKFTASLRERHPSIDTTAFIVHRNDLPRVAGRFGADLHHGADHQLFGPPLDSIAAPRIGKREGLEGITHQLATIYCPDSPPAATPWRIKTVLEVLRAVAVRNEPGPQRYADLAAADTVRALTEPVVVTRLVRAREHTTALPLTAGHAYDLLIAAICQLFGVAPGPQELIATLHTFPAGAHLLDGFQHAVIAATIILYGPPGLRCAAAAALHVILTAIDPATLTSARPALDALAAISPVEFRRGIDHPNHVLRQHLQALRRDYYGWLGPHNFGRCPVTNYRGPAPTTPPNVRRSAHG